MKISFINKQIKDIESNLEIILLKKHKYLKVNDLFIKDTKFYVKIANFKQLTK